MWVSRWSFNSPCSIPHVPAIFESVCPGLLVCSATAHWSPQHDAANATGSLCLSWPSLHLFVPAEWTGQTSSDAEKGRWVGCGYHSSLALTGETGVGSIYNPNQWKAYSHHASPQHAARNNSPASIYSTEARGLRSQLPLAIVGAAHSVPQPAPGTVLLPRACLAQQATLFLQEQVKTSRLINQSFL